MFANKQILIGGIIAGGMVATLGTPLLAQSQFFPIQPNIIQAGAVGQAVAPSFGQAVLPNQNPAVFTQGQVAPNMPTTVAPAVNIPPIQTGAAGYGYTGQTAPYGANLVAAPTFATSYTQPAVQYQQAPQYAQYVQQAPQYVQQAPTYTYTQAQPQPAPTYTYVQAQPQPAATYAYVQAQPQPAPTYAYVQAQPQQSVAQYQYYATATQPTLPQPQVYTTTINTGYTQTGAAASYSSAQQNIIPFRNCVAGCQEACSQNQSFMSHCVKACASQVKLANPTQSTPVDWRMFGNNAGQAAINGIRG